MRSHTVAAALLSLLSCLSLSLSLSVSPSLAPSLSPGRLSPSAPTNSLWEALFGVKGGERDERNTPTPAHTNIAAAAAAKKVMRNRVIPAKKAPLREAAAAVNNRESAAKSVSESSSAAQGEREALYEAYNQLHTLAQDFQKPFDAPAVIVVGHQTSGKSALIEALMGFQFNTVGGGTKTRRPIALRMQYNPLALTPACFLTLDNGKEEARSLTEIQAYIDAENKRLERDNTRSFDAREINIRVEYKFCPNMILIDTPGLIHAPKGRSLTVQQRAIAQAAREAEQLVLSKIRCEDYLILCVEDTTDWKHATTRNVVMQADPSLSRTVLVTTKLDTKLPQFAEREDLKEFVAAPLIRSLFAHMLGGPFFTSVPAGRVMSQSLSHNAQAQVESKPSDADSSPQTGREWRSQEEFVDSVRRAERRDREFIAAKLRSLPASHSSHTETSALLQTVGVSRLRAFLEARVEHCYRRNVNKIIPLLQQELRITQTRLTETERALQSLSLERLRQSANAYRDRFAKEIVSVIQGTVRVRPEVHGETLESEQQRGGSFVSNFILTEGSTRASGKPGSGRRERDGKSSAPTHSQAQTQAQSNMLTEEAWQEILEREVSNNHHRLFGGAQFNRAMREFTLAVRHLPTACVSEDEIANAAGVGETHNGVNFMRAACVIAMDKAQQSFEPLLEALRVRMEHIMKRLFPVVHELVRETMLMSPSLRQAQPPIHTHTYTYSPTGDPSHTSTTQHTPSSSHTSTRTPTALDIDAHIAFTSLVRSLYESFIDAKLDECVRLCRADLIGMTRFVTWDVEDRSGSSTLFRLLPTPKRMVEIYKLALANRDRNSKQRKKPHNTHNEEEEEDEDTFLSHEDADTDRRTQKKKSRSGKGSDAERVIAEWQQANTERESATRPQTQSNSGFFSRLRRHNNNNNNNAVAKTIEEQEQEREEENSFEGETERKERGPYGRKDSQALSVTALPEDDPELSDYYKVVQLTEEMVCGSSASRTSALITSLVHYIISSWRNYFARTITMKFNCYFLLPFSEEFATYLRDQLDYHYDASLSELFDVAETRRSLSLQREELLAECDANHKLQRQFDRIAATLSTPTQTQTPTGSAERGRDTVSEERQRPQ